MTTPEPTATEAGQAEERAGTRVTTIRLPEEMAVEVELVARVLRLSVSEVIRTAIAEYLTKRKGEAEFARRLSLRIDQDRRILERLAVQCCCDQTSGRLVVCPVHPDRSSSPGEPS